MSRGSLAERLKAGDEDAVTELVECYSDRLLRVAALIVRDVHLAEDMVQESLFDAVTHIHQFRGDSSIYTWLYTILVRRCRKQLKKKFWNMLSFWPKERFDGIEDSHGSPERDVEDTLDRTQLRDAVAKLPARHREVIALYYYEQMSIEEVADVTGEPVGTIKSRLYRARKSLQEILGRRDTNGSAGKRVEHETIF